MNFISLFSGIECASVAFNPLGWNCFATAEIEQFPSAVIAYHYPDVPNLGDVSNVDWKEYHGAVELICGGSPCQSFSVAGLRQGLDDPRGNLMLEFLRAVDEISPRWVLWENVPGVISSTYGEDFRTFIEALTVMGYGVCWRILDAQWYGLAQRRRRVFVVGYLGDWRPSVSVLFEPAGLPGNHPTSREKREALAGNNAGCAITSSGSDFVGSLCARDYKGVGSQYVDEGKILVAASGQSNAEIGQDCSPTLSARQYKDHPILFKGDSDPLELEPLIMAPTFSKRKAQQLPTRQDGLSYALTTSGTPNVLSRERVRRLTPLECERLQGLPDHYTRIPYKGKPAEQCPDGPRYKAIGNGWAVPCVRWIGEGIEAWESKQ